MNPRLTFIHNTIFIILVALSLVVLIDQTKENEEHYKEKKKWFKNAIRDEHRHWLLIWRKHFHLPYVIALETIAQSPYQKFWLIGEDLDVMMVMNYFAYPKELRSSVETQMELERQHYADIYTPFEHTPPEEYEDIIRTH